LESGSFKWQEETIELKQTASVTFEVSKALRDSVDGDLQVTLIQQRYKHVTPAGTTAAGGVEGQAGTTSRPQSGPKSEQAKPSSAKKTEKNKKGGTAAKGKKGAEDTEGALSWLRLLFRCDDVNLIPI
jgi:hypothetical protein